MTAPPLGSAQDQATVAARAALLIKERWPDAVVSMATGRGAVRGRTAVGEVVELAARSLKSGSHPAMEKPASGVLIDPLSAKLLEGRFAQKPQLLLDDLQWGDELTVSVLDELLRELSATPLFVLAFARPEVYEIFPKLWHSHKAQETPLKGLSKSACERLIAQVLGKDVVPEAIARAVEQCAGNALFLEELIRSIAEGTPEIHSQTVVAMLQSRLSRLDSNVRRAVRAASVFGQTFWRGGVAAVLDLPAEQAAVESWLGALVESEMIEPRLESRLLEEREYIFRHALVREAVYSLLTAGDLVTGHRLAAHFLEERGERDAAMIAEHYEQGGDSKRAASFYCRAAENALENLSLGSALRWAERGVACGADGALLGTCARSKPVRVSSWDGSSRPGQRPRPGCHWCLSGARLGVERSM